MLIGHHGQFDPLLFSEIRAGYPGAEIVPYVDIQEAQRRHEMRAIVTRSGLSFDAVFFDSAPRLQLVVKAGSGTDNIDHAAAEARGITVMSTGGSERSVAELALALMFVCSRHVIQHNSAMRAGDWGSKKQFVGTNLSEKRLGLIGFGRIGREAAALARAIGMAVQVYDRSIDKPEKAAALKALGVVSVSDLKQLMTTSNIVSLHLPWMPDNAPLLGPKEIAALPDGGIVINTARAQLVDRAALAEALSTGRIAAGLDVHYAEGGDGDSDLIALPNVAALPHIGAQTSETHKNIAKRAAQMVAAHLATEGESHEACNL